jgi:hypothetical protein
VFSSRAIDLAKFGLAVPLKIVNSSFTLASGALPVTEAEHVNSAADTLMAVNLAAINFRPCQKEDDLAEMRN